MCWASIAATIRVPKKSPRSGAGLEVDGVRHLKAPVSPSPQPATLHSVCALASHLVELSQTVMHYLGAVFPGDPVSQPNQPPLNARQSAGSPEASREALHEGHRRVASIA